MKMILLPLCCGSDSDFNTSLTRHIQVVRMQMDVVHTDGWRMMVLSRAQNRSRRAANITSGHLMSSWRKMSTADIFYFPFCAKFDKFGDVSNSRRDEVRQEVCSLLQKLFYCLILTSLFQRVSPWNLLMTRDNHRKHDANTDFLWFSLTWSRNFSTVCILWTRTVKNMVLFLEIPPRFSGPPSAPDECSRFHQLRHDKSRYFLAQQSQKYEQ